MKNKVMGLLALASCVVLSGCGEQKKEVKIEIAELPTTLVAGDSIDLKNYIVCSGGEGGYSINFDDENFAKVSKESETEFVLNEYGSVTFTVDYSGKSQQATISVGSVLLNNFLKETKDAGYEYATITYDEEGYADGWNNFGEKFYANYWFEQTGEYDYAPGGFLEAGDGKVYSFTLDLEDNLEFSLTGNEPENISLYSWKLAFPQSGYEVKTEEYKGEKYELLCLKENENGDVAKLFEDFFWLDPALIAQYGYEIHSVEIMEDELQFEDGTKVPTYDLYAMAIDTDKSSEYYGEEVPLAITSLTFDEEMFFKDSIEEYVKSGEIPASKYSLSVDKIKSAVEGHNYQIDYSYNWYDATVSDDGMNLIRGDALDENPFVDPAEMDEKGYYLNEFFNAFGGFSAYVKSDKVFVDVPNGTKYGLIEQSDVAWDYAYKTDKYVATENLGRKLFSSQVNEKMYNFEFLAGIGLGDEEVSVYDGMFINSKEKISENEYKYSLVGATCPMLFEALFIDSIYDGEYNPEDAIRSHYNTLDIVATLMYEYYLSDYLNVEITEKYDGEELDELIFDFIWFDYIEPASYYDDYQYFEYVLSADIKFGECAMPTFDVEFPAA